MKTIIDILKTLSGIPVIAETLCVLCCLGVTTLLYLGCVQVRAVVDMYAENSRSHAAARISIENEPRERELSEQRFEMQRRQLAHAH